MRTSVAIATYLCLWWTLLFASLPLGLRTQEEDGEVVPGTPASAPTKPKLLRIFAINTLVTTIVFAIIYFVIDRGLITFDD